MISVLIPTYNKATEICQTIGKTFKVLKESGLEYEVIVINDGSTDNTDRKVLGYTRRQGKIRIVGYEENRGKGHALKYGFQYACGDQVIFQDADSDISPCQIPQLLAYMEKNNADVVIGSKRHPLSRVNSPRTRRLLSSGYALMVRLLFNLRVKDTQVGLKLYKREVLEKVMPRMLTKRFAFDVELLANARRMGYTIIEAPVELSFSRDSRFPLSDMWNILIDTIVVFYRMKILRGYDKNSG